MSNCRSRFLRVVIPVLLFLSIAPVSSSTYSTCSVRQFKNSGFLTSIEPGTDITFIDAKSFEIRSGKVLFFAGKTSSSVLTNLARIAVPASSVCIVELKAEVLRIVNLSGAELKVTLIEVLSVSESLTLSDGMELLVCPLNFSEEELTPVDGIERVKQSDRRILDSRVVVNKIDLLAAVQKERLLSCSKFYRLAKRRILKLTSEISAKTK